MKAIDYLMEEHREISIFLDEMEDYCTSIIGGEKLNEDKFRQAIIYIREFADGTHHKKEEDILFKYMLEELGQTGKTLIQNGMLVEHDLARLSVYQLEEALDSYQLESNNKNILDILSNMMNYIYILRRHIDKEDRLVYKFALDNLSEKSKKAIEQEFLKEIK